ncbi:uncharacterized protein LOC143749574 [Siphateles boraxobius]|uniref:uncharacterized protein LOC143749574 n=1 Tax=Siphateles boraxobius TaxID=180520 RepID=UPI004062F6BA
MKKNVLKGGTSNEVKTAIKEEDGEEDVPEIEGAKEEEVIENMTTFQKEDEKEHTREKDLIQEDEDLTVDTAQERKNGQLEEDVKNRYPKVEDSDSWSDTDNEVSLDKEDGFFLQRVFLHHHLFFLLLKLPGKNKEKRITSRDCSGLTLSLQAFALSFHIAVLLLQATGLKYKDQPGTRLLLNALAIACSLTAQ